MASEIMTQTEQLVIVSNLTVAIATIALVIVTALCAYYAYKDHKENNRHEETINGDLVKVIHDVIAQESVVEAEKHGKHHE